MDFKPEFDNAMANLKRDPVTAPALLAGRTNLLGQTLHIEVEDLGLVEKLTITCERGTRTVYGRQIVEALHNGTRYVLTAFEDIGRGKLDPRASKLAKIKQGRMRIAKECLKEAGFDEYEQAAVADAILSNRGYGTSDWSRSGLDVILEVGRESLVDSALMRDVHQLRHALSVFARGSAQNFDVRTHLISRTALTTAQGSVCLGDLMVVLEKANGQPLTSPRATYFIDVLLAAKRAMLDAATIRRQEQERVNREKEAARQAAEKAKPRVIVTGDIPVPDTILIQESTLGTDVRRSDDDRATQEELRDLAEFLTPSS